MDVPFTLVDHLAIVPVRINGSRELAFVLDTGAARMVIDEKTGAEIGLKQAESDTIGGAGAGRVPVHHVHNVTVDVRGVSLNGCDFVATDLSHVAEIIGHRVDGILGYQFFKPRAVTIDYAKERIVIRDSNETAHDLGTELPIRIEKGWPLLRASLQVRGLPETTDEFLIDSGSNDAVDHPIAAKAADRNAVDSGNGLGAPVGGFLATAETLTVGPFRLRNLALGSGGATEQTSKLIGGAVLSRFVVTFDYPHSRIFLMQQPLR